MKHQISCEFLRELVLSLFIYLGFFVAWVHVKNLLNALDVMLIKFDLLPLLLSTDLAKSGLKSSRFYYS